MIAGEIMKYKVIFTNGLDDDYESLTREYKCDVLILDEQMNYYCPQFMTISRIESDFGAKVVCFLEENLVVMRKITKETILQSIPILHKWMFYKRWVPLTKEILDEYFVITKEDWVTFTITVDD